MFTFFFFVSDATKNFQLKIVKSNQREKRIKINLDLKTLKSIFPGWGCHRAAPDCTLEIMMPSLLQKFWKCSAISFFFFFWLSVQDDEMFNCSCVVKNTKFSGNVLQTSFQGFFLYDEDQHLNLTGIT